MVDSTLTSTKTKHIADVDIDFVDETASCRFVIEFNLSNKKKIYLPVKGRTVIGRSNKADFNLVDDTIEHRHCVVMLDNDILSIMDLDSKVGTFLQEKKLRPHRMYILEKGDKITVGNISGKVNDRVKIELGEVEKKSLHSDTSTSQKEEKTKKKNKQKQSVLFVEDIGFVEKIKLVVMKMTNKFSGGKLFDEQLTSQDIPPAQIEKNQNAENINEDTNVAIDNNIDEETDEILDWKRRTFAYFLDLMMAICLYPNFSFTHNWALTQNIASIFGDNKAFSIYIAQLIEVYFFYLMATALLFAITPGQYLLGGRVYGAALTERKSALLRHLIGFFTDIFVVFNLKLFKGKVSLKESITRSEISLAGEKWAFQIWPISFLIIFVLFFQDKFLIDTSHFENIKFQQSMRASDQLSIGSSDKRYYSTTLGLRGKIPDWQDIVMLPVYDTLKNTFSNKIEFIDLKTGKTIFFEKLGKPSFLVLLQSLMDNDPFAKNHFEFLSQSKIVQGQSNKYTKLEQQELIQLLQMIGSIDKNINSYSFYLSKGPYVSQYLKFRTALENELQTNFSQTKFAVSALANSTKLEITSLDKTNRVRFMSYPLDGQDAIYVYTYKNNSDGTPLKFAQDFQNHFYNNLAMESNSSVDFFLNDADALPLFFLDYLQMKPFRADLIVDVLRDYDLQFSGEQVTPDAKKLFLHFLINLEKYIMKRKDHPLNSVEFTPVLKEIMQKYQTQPK